MDETRAQAYLQLINTLLTCPSGEEPQIIQANLELVDQGFLQVCEVVAENLAEEGQENAADFLRDIVNQQYLDFLQDLLQAEESNSEISLIYSMLGQRQHLLNARFTEILQLVAEYLIPENSEAIGSILRSIENLSMDISNFPSRNRANNIEIAIAGYQIVLSNREPGSEKWAQTQNNLGNAYLYRIREEKAENIEMAIAFYTAALSVRTRKAFPQNWAMTQNNLANAYCNRIMGEKAENIEMAIAFYTAALSVRTREAFPQDWAQTQHNLGLAYSDRIRGEKAENIELAIAFCTAALKVRTRFPQDWAQMQNNLAAAYSDRIRGEKAENIELAIAFCTAALKVRTRLH